MGGAAVEIKVDDEEVRRLFDRLRGRALDTRPVMEVIGELVRTSVVRNFESGGRPRKWEPLSEATRKRKRNKGRILIEDTNLMDSIKPKAGRNRVEVGTGKIYAAIHQFGGKAGRGHKAEIPARPYLMVQDEDMVEIRAAIADHILEGEG